MRFGRLVFGDSPDCQLAILEGDSRMLEPVETHWVDVTTPTDMRHGRACFVKSIHVPGSSPGKGMAVVVRIEAIGPSGGVEPPANWCSFAFKSWMSGLGAPTSR